MQFGAPFASQYRWFFGIVGCCTMLIATAASAQQKLSTGGIKVQTCTQNVGGRQVYHYLVRNGSQAVANGLDIGHDRATRYFELEIPPIGFDETKPGHLLETGPIRADVATSPPGWRVDLVNEEETDYLMIGWSVLNPDDLKGIPPGGVQSAYSVALSKPSDAYLNTHWTVFTDEGDTFTGALEALQPAAPALSVTLAPQSRTSDGRMLSITATISAQDAVDPNPKVRLESIVANQPIDPTQDVVAQLGKDTRTFSVRGSSADSAERVYTVTYSATNFCGVRTEQSATITIKPSSAQ